MRNAHPKTTGSSEINTEKIKIPILVPLFAVILALLVTFTIAIYRLQQEQINDDLHKRIENTNKFFQDELGEDKRLLGGIIHLFKNDTKLQQLWLAKNREALLEYTTPTFEKLRNDYGITHFYFIDVNQTCFLRVHNPKQFGDHINRTTLANASRYEKPSWGIELGKFGTFTLRNVHPWFINNSLAGFIELGEEIEHITPRLEEALDVDLVFLIDKALLNRKDWEQGQKMMGRTGNWDLLPNSVVVDSVLPVIPPRFAEFIGLSHVEHGNRLISAKVNGSTYRAGFVELRDVTGHDVGDILIIKNISERQTALYRLLALVTTLCLVLGTLLVTFFYAHITSIEKRLIGTHASLRTEIEKRKKAESELRAHRDNLEELVKTRTREIERANKELQQEILQRTTAESSLEKANTDLESTVTRLIQTNRQLSEFAHSATHDLKTPLRGIGTLAQWLAKDYRDKFDENGRRQIELLVRRVGHIDKLINAILLYSTITRNMENERPLDLNRLLKEALAEIKLPPNIEIAVVKNLPAMICEEKLIQLVFYHLLTNAIKSIDKPKGRITIGCSEQGPFWQFSVSDNGCGIEPQHFERIFNLFQTLQSHEETNSAGAGLALVRKIIELYDGQIWLRSKAGRGTTFFFTLPKQPAAVASQTLEPVAT